MPELRDGQVLTLDQIQNDKFTYNGKELKFEKTESNQNVYEAKLEPSEQEKQAGSLARAFSINIGAAQGVVTSYVLAPEAEGFEDLTDSEKITKLNSLEYQHQTNEPTDVGDSLDVVLEKNLGTPQPQNKQELDKALNEQQQQQNQKQKSASVESKSVQQQPQKVNQNREFNLSNVKSAEG